MLHCSPRRILCALIVVGACCAAHPPVVCAQEAYPTEVARQYQRVVMEVLSNRLASEVVVDRGQVRLATPPSRIIKDMRAIVQASVPYYLEGAVADFKKFRPRVKEALAGLDGWTVPSAPRGWEEEEWVYFQVQGALEDVVLLVALDIGVYTNEALARGVKGRSELTADWTQIQGGRDPLSPQPLPDFGTASADNSTLEGLGGDAVSGAAAETEGELAAALRQLTARIDALERRMDGGTPPRGSSSSLPAAGVDGRWSPGGGAGLVPDRLPEQFTLQFPAGSAAIGLSAEYGLNTLVEWMAARPNLRVLVTGHSDATGSERANMELSRRRAQVVRYYLLERGVPAERVTAAHFGEQRPEWGAGFDRRVQVQLLLD